jgi:hypothetical protein
MKKIMLTLLFALPVFVFGQTYITDKQEVFGVWNVNSSPYIVEGEAIVPLGKTLEIKPGVIVQFNVGDNRDYLLDGSPNSEFKLGFLRVKGTLVAKGTAKKMIEFTSYGTGTWGNICMFDSDKNVFEYCHFSKAHYIRSVTSKDNATGALSFNNSKGVVKNCLFWNNGWTAINCKNGAQPQLINLTIVGNKYGIECNSDSKPTIQNVILWNNEEPFYINGGASVILKNSSIQVEKIPEEAIDNGGNYTGTNPMFVDSEKRDFHIQNSSPLFGKKIGILY